MTYLEELAAQAALNKMFRGGYFSICTLDDVLKMGSIIPDRKAYAILHTLHCVDFKDMPDELRSEIPELIRQCLGIATIFQFDSLKQKTITISSIQRLINYVNG